MPRTRRRMPGARRTTPPETPARKATMKVLHIITRMILGGAQENTLLSVLGQQEEPGLAVRLASGPTTGPEGSLVDEAKAAGVDWVDVPDLLRPARPLRDLRALRHLRRLIREWRPDVVHTHSSKAGILGRQAAWAERVPFIVHTIHGLPFHPYQNPLARRVFIASERWAARRCHRIVSVADAMTEQAVAAGLAPPERFVTVYSGMRLDPFLVPSADREANRARWGFGPGDIVIGKVARLFELKGHDDLFDAFAAVAPAFPGARLLLVGGGIWRERLERRAEALGIRGRVVFAGLVPHDEVAGAMHAMDVLVHASLREGLARVLPQALLAGKPVVSYDVDGAREVVRPGETGWLVPPRDTKALAAAVGEVLADLPEARRRAGRGRALCRERFDWRLMVRRLLEIYREGLADGAAHRG